MRVNSLSFPHPILGANDDITGSYKIDGPFVSKHGPKIRLSMTHVLRNHDLQEYLDAGSAEFMVEVCCSKTLFRRAYFSSSTEHLIDIDEPLLRDQVTVMFFLVAKRDIRDYLPKTAHSDFSKYSFFLKKGDLLAYGGSTQFAVLKQWITSNAVGSFMEIVDGEFRNGPMKINLQSEKISIQLSTADFDSYDLLQRSGRFDNIFHSAVALPALIFAISQFIDAPDQFEGYSWAAVMKDKSQNDSRLNKINWTAENAPWIAQEILDNPFHRTLETITAITLEADG